MEDGKISLFTVSVHVIRLKRDYFVGVVGEAAGAGGVIGAVVAGMGYG